MFHCFPKYDVLQRNCLIYSRSVKESAKESAKEKRDMNKINVMENFIIESILT